MFVFKIESLRIRGFTQVKQHYVDRMLDIVFILLEDHEWTEPADCVHASSRSTVLLCSSIGAYPGGFHLSAAIWCVAWVAILKSEVGAAMDLSLGIDYLTMHRYPLEIKRIGVQLMWRVYSSRTSIWRIGVQLMWRVYSSRTSIWLPWGRTPMSLTFLGKCKI